MRIKVTSGLTAVGLPVLAPIFTRILNTVPGVEADFIEPEEIMDTNWNTVDVVWNLGFFFDVDCLFDWLKALYPEMKTVNTWVGTDILNSIGWFKQRSKCYRCALRSTDIHVADGLNLVQELKQLGIENAYYVPSVPDTLPLLPITQKNRVAVYAPAHRKEFYRYQIAVEVAKLEPSYHFDFYSITPDNDFPNLPNCHFKGFIQGEQKLQAFADDAYLVMLPEHGSVSMMLIEFMMMGRRVISNIEAPFVYRVREPVTVEDVKGALERAFADTCSKGLNEEASKHYLKEYGFEKVRGYIEPVLKELEE